MKISDFKTRAWQHRGKARKYRQATGSTTDVAHFLAQRYVDVLSEHVPAGAVLDMGSGTGVMSMALADRGYAVTAVDVSVEMLEQLSEAKGERRIEIRRGNIFQLPAADQEFDAAISRWVLPHFPQWPLAVIEAARVLKPGGVLIFDACLTESVETAWSRGPIPASFGYDFSPDAGPRTYYAHAGEAQVRLAADSAGLTLESIRPVGFFRQNASIAAALGPRYEEYKSRIEEWFANPEVGAFLRWFDSEVTPELPLALATEALVVLRKPADGGGLKRWLKTLAE